MVKAWKEKVVIPTYEVGEPEKTPIFLEKRVYQGSSGKVYPYPVIESISDEKIDKEYDAIFLENEYIKVMVLPELGGRIQMAYDKVARRHFIYYNHVIKPALVGLAGPWISGGIEFNWPQHHRPSTFMPVDSMIRENKDGSISVLVNEYERMTHQKGMAAFTLRPGRAYLEIEGTLYNPTDMPQTFLWWANPAVAVNDYYQSVFPPDINAVFDHGKRAVSSFPIATGTYYKMDYSAGVDISNYKNIKVPTSYMGVNSKYDFEGGYENDTKAGMLHVASHHFSPGKKQWTWGNGDFGRAWDRNLTDEDGPYIELMAGVFTENQPDFSWLMPHEEKSFTQYFLPYRELGIVKNANKDILMNIESISNGKALLRLFATSTQSVKISVETQSDKKLFENETRVSPEQIFETVIDLKGFLLTDVIVRIFKGGKEILNWKDEKDDLKPIPDAAEAALSPEEIKTNEQLYLTGLHLEQYRHATFEPLDYYNEALKRDSQDVRCNNAKGLLLMRRGRFDLALPYFESAVKVLKKRNPNPYDGEPVYNLGLCLKYLGRYDEAYNYFYKSTWNGAWQEAGFYECALISLRQKRYEDAEYELDRALIRNSHNHQARALKSALLSLSGKKDAAFAETKEALRIEPFNFSALFIENMLSENENKFREFKEIMREESHNYNETALLFTSAGLTEYAQQVWEIALSEQALSPMSLYYKGWCLFNAGKQNEANETFQKASELPEQICFTNRLEAILALQAALEINPTDAKAAYYLGNIYYDKKQVDLAEKYWEISMNANPEFPIVWRNLALISFNKKNDSEKTLKYMETAFLLDESNPRILMELDQLYKKLHKSHNERLEFLEKHSAVVTKRDDLILEKATLMNQIGLYKDAIKLIDSHVFHPWEGGEGKVPKQYQIARVALAKKAIENGDFDDAIKLLQECLEYPLHLGEGKLYGAQDNDFLYYLGVAWEGKGDRFKAEEYWKKATEGPQEPTPALYYNDAQPDKIYFAGLAYQALGQEEKARSYFNRLADYGRQHIFDDVTLDYFAVSLPDLLIWDESLSIKNKVHCLYMLALGNQGLGNHEKARKYFFEAAELDPNHQGILQFLN